MRICATRSRGDTAFIARTIRFTAPTSSMKVIWKRLAATMRLIGKEETTPAADARSATEGSVRKYRIAISSVSTHPAVPATSAGVRRRMSSRKMKRTGSTARNTLKPSTAPPQNPAASCSRAYQAGSASKVRAPSPENTRRS